MATRKQPPHCVDCTHYMPGNGDTEGYAKERWARCAVTLEPVEGTPGERNCAHERNSGHCGPGGKYFIKA